MRKARPIARAAWGAARNGVSRRALRPVLIRPCTAVQNPVARPAPAMVEAKPVQSVSQRLVAKPGSDQSWRQGASDRVSAPIAGRMPEGRAAGFPQAREDRQDETRRHHAEDRQPQRSGLRCSSFGVALRPVLGQIRVIQLGCGSFRVGPRASFEGRAGEVGRAAKARRSRPRRASPGREPSSCPER